MKKGEESSPRHLRDGQLGVDRTEAILGDVSVSFLTETRTRGIEHVSMWRLASTQSKHNEPDQSQILSYIIVQNFIV